MHDDTDLPSEATALMTRSRSSLASRSRVWLNRGELFERNFLHLEAPVFRGKIAQAEQAGHQLLGSGSGL